MVASYQPRISKQPRLRAASVDSVICHCYDTKITPVEQYLVEWKRLPNQSVSVYSWHTVEQLCECLPLVQDYLDALSKKREQRRLVVPDLSSRRLSSQERKRKSPDDEDALSIAKPYVGLKRPSVTTSAISVSSDDDGESQDLHNTISHEPERQEVYNGALHIDVDGCITSKPFDTLSKKQPVKMPTPAMEAHALQTFTATSRARYAIQMSFSRKLARIPGPPVTLDRSTTTNVPRLAFEFIDENRLGKGVQRAHSDTVVGCGSYAEAGISCRPHMGGARGCEYSRVCECLEEAPIDEARLTQPQVALLNAGQTMGLPKRFPYTNATEKHPACLCNFYLQKRDMIYECNPRCKCGPRCKTRLVQRGRTIPLQIFKTANRGWGLRSPEPLLRGQFVDTYRGEIVTSSEADSRQKATVSNNCYLYDLDKHWFNNANTDDQYYVVDGEHIGGPTRFMNHSCEPNCGQYTVSTNKFDRRIYELAFFAVRDIPAGEELTFDYLDKDADEDEDDEEAEAEDPKQLPATKQECLCGSKNCRRWLWV